MASSDQMTRQCCRIEDPDGSWVQFEARIGLACYGIRVMYPCDVSIARSRASLDLIHTRMTATIGGFGAGVVAPLPVWYSGTGIFTRGT